MRVALVYDLRDDYRALGFSEEEVAEFDSVETIDALAGAHNAHQSKIGADKIVIPGDDASPEEMDTLFTALGRPAEAKAYEIPMPEGVEASEGDLAFQTNFKDKAFELGLNQKQVSGLAEWNNELLAGGAVEAEAAASAETEKTKASLRQHYGVDADNKLDAANAFIANMGGDDVVAAFADSGANRNFAVIDMFIKVAEMAAGEGGLVGAGGGGGGSTIQSQIDALKAEPAYTDEKAKGHKGLKARVGKLYKMKAQNKG